MKSKKKKSTSERLIKILADNYPEEEPKPKKKKKKKKQSEQIVMPTEVSGSF